MSVMSWAPTARRNAIGAAARMVARTEWRESEHGPVLTQIVRDALTADDRVARLHAANAIRFIDPNQESTLALVRSRLLVEPEPHVAAVLTNQLAVLANAAPDAVDAVLGEIATTNYGRLGSSPRMGLPTRLNRSCRWRCGSQSVVRPRWRPNSSERGAPSRSAVSPAGGCSG